MCLCFLCHTANWQNCLLAKVRFRFRIGHSDHCCFADILWDRAAHQPLAAWLYMGQDIEVETWITPLVLLIAGGSSALPEGSSILRLIRLARL